jgi:hypothetical protein
VGATAIVHAKQAGCLTELLKIHANDTLLRLAFVMTQAQSSQTEQHRTQEQLPHAPAQSVPLLSAPRWAKDHGLLVAP